MSLQKDIKKFLNIKVMLGLLIFLIISFMWFKYIAGLVIVAIFAPITFLTVRYSKMVPHISIESNTGMSAFMGYLFGPVIGFIYAIIVGLFSYVSNSFISATYLSIPVLGGLCAILMGVFARINVNLRELALDVEPYFQYLPAAGKPVRTAGQLRSGLLARNTGADQEMRRCH